jgi:hypothetical protein
VKNVLRAGGKLLAKRSTKQGYCDIFLLEEGGSTREAIHPITLRSLLKSKEIGEVQRKIIPGEQVEFRIVEPFERIEWILERAKRDSASLPTYRQFHAETAIRETLEQVAPLLDRDTRRAIQKVLNFYYHSLEDERSFREGEEHE